MNKITEATASIVEAVQQLSPEAVDWPFLQRGFSSVELAMRCEKERRKVVTESISGWFSTNTWPLLDQVDRYLVQHRLTFALDVLGYLDSAPVTLEEGPHELRRWIVTVGWERWGILRWEKNLEIWNSWYDLGLRDAEGRGFGT